ncbi:MAG: DUF5977 domain-containing protein [Spirosomataceae bacterium]
MDSLAALNYQNLKLTANPIVVFAEPVVLGVGESRVDLRYCLDVYVQNAFQSGTFDLYVQHEVTEVPLADGSALGAFFEINRPLHDLLSIPPPKFTNTAISICDLATRQFYTVLTRKNGTTVLDTATKATEWAIRSGVEERDYADYKETFFTRLIGEKNRFLTWKPDGLSVSKAQPEYLYFLSNFSPLPSELRLRVTYYTAEGETTFTAKTLAYVSPMTVYCLPVGFTALGLDSVEETILKYEVWVANQANERLSEVRSFRLDYAHYRSEKFLLVQNSLGGYDTIRCVGNSVEALKVNRQLVEQFTGYYYLPTMQEQLINRVTGERQLIVNVGNRLNADYRQYLEEVLLSENLFLLSDSDFVPLIPAFDSLVLGNPLETLIERQLAFRYANQNTRYSRLPKIDNDSRATGWKMYTYSCEIGGTGLRTGRRIVNSLVKYYLDDNTNVIPLETAANVPGAEGYIAPTDDAGCAVATTPYVNVEYSKASSFNKTGCGGGLWGSAPTITIAAGLYGSAISQADADAKAVAAWGVLNTQAYADANGSCLSPWFYDLSIPTNQFHYRVNTPSLNVGMVRDGEGAGYQGNYPLLVSLSPDPSWSYAGGSNDIKLPTTNQFMSQWRWAAYNDTGVTRTLVYAVYKNGVLMESGSVGLNHGDSYNVYFTTILSKTKVYVQWSW